MRGLDGGEIGVGFEVEHGERAHFVAAAACRRRARPIANGRPGGRPTRRRSPRPRARRSLRGRARRSNSSSGYIRRRGPRRNTSAPCCSAPWARAGRRAHRSRRGRTVRTARRLAALAVRTPAGKTPVVGSRRFGHKSLHTRASRAGSASARPRKKNARGPVSRVLSSPRCGRWATIPLGGGLPRPSSNQPGRRGRIPHVPPLFGLAPGGVYRAGPVASRRGALLPHPFALTRPKTGSLLSVALSLTPAEAGAAGRYPAPSFCGARTFLAGTSPAAVARPSGSIDIGRQSRGVCGLLRPRQQQREQLGPAFAVDHAVDDVGAEAALEGDDRLSAGR